MKESKCEAVEVTLIRGDGIGPEIADVALSVLDALGAPFAWDERQAGLAAFTDGKDALPEETLASIRRTGLSLKGPLATPPGGGYRSPTVRLREAFQLYANVRPAKTMIPGRYSNVDILLIRENLEGLYIGQEYYIEVGGDPHAVGVAMGINTKEGASRILRHTFETAVKLGRKRVTIVHKANILKILSGVFLEAAKQIAPEYEGRLVIDDKIVDACAMELVLHPEQFDVIVTTNLFGDILSDLLAGLVGGLGVVSGANIGANAAIFEAIHGTAPDIAGKGVANPTAMLMATGMMLDHIGAQDKATQLRHAILAALKAGHSTADMGGRLSTHEFGRAVVANL